MNNIKYFFSSLSVNLTNVFQNLGDVVECATKEGAYCADHIGFTKDGENRYIAIEFEKTTAPWDKIQLDDGRELTLAEFQKEVLSFIESMIEEGVLEDGDEYTLVFHDSEED